MFEVKIDIQNLGEFEKSIDKNLLIALDKIGMYLQAETIKKTPIDLGQLRSSIKYTIIPSEMAVYVGSDVEYAEFLEYGTKPHVVPLKAIEPWAKRHGLNPWAVKKSIEKKGMKSGTPASPFLSAGNTYRPFLRSTMFQSKPEVIEIVKREIE